MTSVLISNIKDQKLRLLDVKNLQKMTVRPCCTMTLPPIGEMHQFRTLPTNYHDRILILTWLFAGRRILSRAAELPFSAEFHGILQKFRNDR